MEKLFSLWTSILVSQRKIMNGWERKIFLGFQHHLAGELEKYLLPSGGGRMLAPYLSALTPLAPGRQSAAPRFGGEGWMEDSLSA